VRNKEIWGHKKEEREIKGNEQGSQIGGTKEEGKIK
jgi:hypothetical protein